MDKDTLTTVRSLLNDIEKLFPKEDRTFIMFTFSPITSNKDEDETAHLEYFTCPSKSVAMQTDKDFIEAFGGVYLYGLTFKKTVHCTKHDDANINRILVLDDNSKPPRDCEKLYGGIEVRDKKSWFRKGTIYNRELIKKMTLLATKNWQVGGHAPKRYTTSTGIDHASIISDIKSSFPANAYTITHMSSLPIMKVKAKEQFNFSAFESTGLYCSRNFVRFIEEDYGESYMYGVVLKKSERASFTTISKPDVGKILRLYRAKDYAEFKARYGDIEGTNETGDYFWKNVAKLFGGIEWRNIQLIWEFFEYKSEGDSCIWNPDIIEKLVPLATRTIHNWMVADSGDKRWSLSW